VPTSFYRHYRTIAHATLPSTDDTSLSGSLLLLSGAPWFSRPRRFTAMGNIQRPRHMRCSEHRSAGPRAWRAAPVAAPDLRPGFLFYSSVRCRWSACESARRLPLCLPTRFAYPPHRSNSAIPRFHFWMTSLKIGPIFRRPTPRTSAGPPPHSAHRQQHHLSSFP